MAMLTLEGRCVQLLRKLNRSNCGILGRTLVGSLMNPGPVRRALWELGYRGHVTRDGDDRYRATDAGRAWLAGQKAGDVTA